MIKIRIRIRIRIRIIIVLKKIIIRQDYCVCDGWGDNEKFVYIKVIFICLNGFYIYI